MNNITIRTAYPNELYHHGIKGQKWGVRRYQNPDGSLTLAGRRRFKKARKAIVRDAEKLAAVSLLKANEYKRLEQKVRKASDKYAVNKTDKNRDRYNKLVAKQQEVLEDGRNFSKTSLVHLIAAKKITDDVVKKNSGMKLKEVPNTVFDAGVAYLKRIDNVSSWTGGLGGVGMLIALKSYENKNKQRWSQ